MPFSSVRKSGKILITNSKQGKICLSNSGTCSVPITLSLHLHIIVMQLKEIFGAGTACVVCPVDRILFKKEVHV